MITMKNGSIKLDAADLAKGEGEKLKGEGYKVLRVQGNGQVVFGKEAASPEAVSSKEKGAKVFADTHAAKAGKTEGECVAIYKAVVAFRKEEAEALKNGGTKVSADAVRIDIDPETDKNLFWQMFAVGKALAIKGKVEAKVTAPEPKSVSNVSALEAKGEEVAGTVAFDNALADKLASEGGFKNYRQVRKAAKEHKDSKAIALRDRIQTVCRKVA